MQKTKISSSDKYQFTKECSQNATLIKNQFTKISFENKLKSSQIEVSYV